MLTAIAAAVAVVLIIWTRFDEVVYHDPLEGIKPPRAPRPAPLLDVPADEAPEEEEAEDEDDSVSQQDLVDLINQGRHLEAVKLYRQATGDDLATAMRFIDKLRSGQ